MTVVSVCMATYNGAAYVQEQLDSILLELEPEDEVVIVDDGSSDDTLRIVNGVGDPRVKMVSHGSNRGYVRAFEDAMTRAIGDVILLADQDDIWIPGRRAQLVQALSRKSVAASSLVLLGTETPLRSPLRRLPWVLSAEQDATPVRNLLRILAGDMPYFGCAMALRREALERVLPMPMWLTESHDLWIATVANVHRDIAHVAEPTVRRRVHSSNASSGSPRGLRAVVASRLLVIRMLLAALSRRRRAGRRGGVAA